MLTVPPVRESSRSARTEGETSRFKRALAVSLQWLVCAGAWLVFVGNFELPELYAGALVAALAATASNVVLEDKIALFYANPGWLALALLLPRDIAVDSFRVLRVLVRRLLLGAPARSGIRTVPFEAGGDDAASATRRGLAITYGTISPNSIVLGIDRERGLLYFHQLEPAPASTLIDRLGGRRS